MKTQPYKFRYPSTRYTGSKRRLLPWLWGHLQHIEFESALDVFGGTASVSLLFKVHGKKVHYNDLLEANQIIGKALIENKNTTVTTDELKLVFEMDTKDYPDFIQSEFENVFFTTEENIWLDRVITNIERHLPDTYKRAIVLSCLFQACLSKRPYNLFHRANLYMRLAEVERSFGNKVTWDKPFPQLISKFVKEYNQAVFDNQRENKVVGGNHAFVAPNGVDLVYLDPPYFSSSGAEAANYLNLYHFLEGIANYDQWGNLIDKSKKHKPLNSSEEILCFTKRDRIYKSFETLLTKFQHNIIVLSYRSDGLPTRNELIEMFRGLGKIVEVHEQRHKYALSDSSDSELLFIAQ
jgi:adenine-specific DNA-methyltransferase